MKLFILNNSGDKEQSNTEGLLYHALKAVHSMSGSEDEFHKVPYNGKVLEFYLSTLDDSTASIKDYLECPIKGKGTLSEFINNNISKIATSEFKPVFEFDDGYLYLVN